MPLPAMTGEAGAAPHAAKEGLLTLFDALFEYVVPIGLFVVGFALANTLGFGWAVANLLTGASNNASLNVNSTAWEIVAGVVAGGTWAAVGACFWSMAGRGGNLIRYVGRGGGSFFFGMGLGEFVAGVGNNLNQNAGLSKAFASIQTKVGTLGSG